MKVIRHNDSLYIITGIFRKRAWYMAGLYAYEVVTVPFGVTKQEVKDEKAQRTAKTKVSSK